MTVRTRVSVEFDSEEEARTAFDALRVDDDEFLSTSLSGRTVTATAAADTVASARRAADDWMACLISFVKE